MYQKNRRKGYRDQELDKELGIHEMSEYRYRMKKNLRRQIRVASVFLILKVFDLFASCLRGEMLKCYIPLPIEPKK